MKMTIYTVPDCQFSKAEKEYLSAHNVQFEEKNLETNKEFLTEMLAVSNNFAGTPVTKVEKDDGQITILKGYTKDEFDKLLGVGQPKETVVNSAVNIPPKDTKPSASVPTAVGTSADKPATPPQTPPLSSEAPAKEETPPLTNNQPPTSAEATVGKPDTSDALTSVLESLQSKSSTEPVAPPTIPSPPTPAPTTNPAPTSNPPTNPSAGGLPNIPEPDFK